MGILHLVNEGLFGGVLRVALAESHYLNELGYESSVLLLFNTYMPNDMLLKYHKASVFRLKNNVLPRHLQDFVNPILRELLGKYLRRMKIDGSDDINCVLLHNLNALPLAKHIRRSVGAKIVLYVHNPTSPPALRKIMRLRPRHEYYVDIFAEVDLVITSSQKMRKYVRETFRVDAYVVPPGCEPSPKFNRGKMRYVLVPQRISLGKKVHVIAKLLSKCNSKFYTIFASSSHYTTAKAIKLVEKSGLKHYKIIVNPSDVALTWLYRHAICSISIIGEPFGMYIIEATSQGTPVIAPKNAGASELFTHGVHGFFFKSEEELPEYVDTLVSNPELATKMGYEAWRICSEKYTWSNHVRKLVEILRNI